MAEYIEFVLLDDKGEERKGKINADDGNEVYLWKVCKTKPSYWKRCANYQASGYYSINVGNKHYKTHRVCYYAHNPEWDIYDTSRDNLIDHIDRNGKNNHITNLRVATNSQNQENNDAKGYWYVKRDKRWCAYVRKHGKLYSKHCKTEEEAIEARKQLKEKYHLF